MSRSSLFAWRSSVHEPYSHFPVVKFPGVPSAMLTPSTDTSLPAHTSVCLSWSLPQNRPAKATAEDEPHG